MPDLRHNHKCLQLQAIVYIVKPLMGGESGKFLARGYKGLSKSPIPVWIANGRLNRRNLEGTFLQQMLSKWIDTASLDRLSLVDLRLGR